MELVNLPNFDYEWELFGENNKLAAKYNQSLAYLYLICNEKHPVLMKQDFDESYLNHLTKLGLKLPKMVKTSTSAKNWWGALENIELERKINSKLITIELLELFEGLYPLPEITNTIPSEENVLLRNPHSVSGEGHYTQNKLHLITESQLKIGLIKTPYYKRVFDYGVFVDIDDTVKFHTLLSNNKGRFIGCGTFVLPPSLKNFEEEIYQNTKKITKYIRSLGARGAFGIDAFIYEDKGRVQLMPVCEINYRKTMGYVFHRLKEAVSIDPYQLLFTKETGKTGVIPLYPKQSKFRAKLFTTQTEEGFLSFVSELLR